MTESNLIKETAGPTCCTVVGGRILHYSVLPSTNRTAIKMARERAPEGLVVLADRQTEGRGRLGRDWYSPQGDGLYFSILFRPRCHEERFALLSLVMGVGVANGLEMLGIKNVGIKWPNDIQIAGRKVAGILVESQKVDGAMFAAAGVGINVSNREFPPEIAERATSIELATGTSHTNEEILGLLLGEIERFYSDVCLGRDNELLSQLRRLDVLDGKEVTVKAGKTIVGTASGIDAMGALILRTADGTEKKITSGEVELVRASKP